MYVCGTITVVPDTMHYKGHTDDNGADSSPTLKI